MKILILRFSSIGDIVLTTPVARCLKNQLGAEVHYLTKQQYEPILAPNPYIDRVFTFQNKLGEVLRLLRQQRYDWIFDLHHNLRSLRVKWALRRPARAFDKLNPEKWLLVHTGINRLPERHIVDRYLDVARHLGITYDGQGLDYFIPPESEVRLPDLYPGLTEGRYIAFAIGATHATKRLPESRLIEVCQNLRSPVALLGGPGEAETGARVAALSGGRVLNLCGVLSLHQSASVIRQAGAVLTHDTGMMHIAAAFRKKIVSVWGNTVPEFGMYPFFPIGIQRNTSMQVSGLSCRPCSKIGYAQCPKKHFHCMNAQDIAQICQTLETR